MLFSAVTPALILNSMVRATTGQHQLQLMLKSASHVDTLKLIYEVVELSEDIESVEGKLRDRLNKLSRVELRGILEVKSDPNYNGFLWRQLSTDQLICLVNEVQSSSMSELLLKNCDHE